MSNYRKIAEEALKRAQDKKKSLLKEGMIYPEGINERMHPQLEDELKNQTHSLGKHPIFPEGDENSFEQKILSDRFGDVTRRYKRAYDVDNIDNQQVMEEMLPLVYETMGLESKHKKALEELAIQMIREEYDMSEDVVEIIAELTPDINIEGTKINPKPITVEMEFKNHDDIINANEEVYKRRFLNAMTQGAAKKCNHMFHMVDDELTKLDPRLPNKYAKMMSSADYMYYVIPSMENGKNGGIVHVQFPNAQNSKAVITVQAMVFPVLIHELVKGVMELLSAHGLPKDKKVGEYVINKADFLAAEPWDMRLGPALWERFTNCINPDDFNLKHQIYSELASLPVREFNVKMREIMGGTKEGKKVIESIVADVKQGLQEDEFNDAMNELSTNKTDDESDDDSEGGFSWDELNNDKPKKPNDDGFDWKDISPII